MSVLEKHGLTEETKSNVLCLTSLILKLDEKIETLVSVNNELIKTLTEIKNSQEEIFGSMECKFSEAWILATEALNGD